MNTWNGVQHALPSKFLQNNDSVETESFTATLIYDIMIVFHQQMQLPHGYNFKKTGSTMKKKPPSDVRTI